MGRGSVKKIHNIELIMKLKELASYLDYAVPLSFQEGYDNSGLQVGETEKEIFSALICLDVTEEIISEAVSGNFDLVISHHPLIFHGLKHLTDRSSVERTIYKAVKNDIAVYSAHTNLDVFENGVSRKMSEKLGLEDVRVLSPLKNKLLKLVTFIPASHLEKVKSAVFKAGAGVIGNYDNCGFATQGTGSFRANESANPFSGEIGKIHFEDEVRFETILFSHLRDRVIEALLSAHPYEEVAYDIYTIENNNAEIGLGCVGKLQSALTEHDFLKLVSGIFDSRGIRYSKLTGKQIRKVALCGGAGISLLGDAIRSGADVFLTADIKYHDFFLPGNNILLIDAGHFETEKFSQEILKELIIKKFPKFAVRFSETNTNPINYF
jgi:dinuclear metal center YbgI/SA1388 family protein